MLGFPADVDGTARQRRLDGDDDGARRRAARQERRRRARRRPARRAARRSRSTCRPRRTAARARRSSCSDSAARRSGRFATDADYRMRVDALEAAIADDLARGVRPIAVDRHRRLDQHRRDRRSRRDRRRLPAPRRLDARGRRVRRSGDPLHASTPARCARSRRPTASRSIRTSGCSSRSRPASSLVRDAEAMRSAFSLVPPYIRQSGSAGERLRPAVVQRVRLPADARIPRAESLDDDAAVRARRDIKAAIEENLALAGYLADRVRAAPDLELDGAAQPQRRLLPVRWRPAEQRPIGSVQAFRPATRTRSPR